MMITPNNLYMLFLVLFPSWNAAFSVKGRAKIGACTAVNKPLSLPASANDDLFFDESSSSSEKKIPSSEKEGDGNKDNYNLETTSRTNKNQEKAPSSAPVAGTVFARGKELEQLRSDLETYRENLQLAQAVKDTKRIESLRKVIEEKEQQDPEIVYKKAQHLIAQAKSSSSSSPPMNKEAKDQWIKQWNKQAEMARSHLPRFQLEGLWVGNYGNHGAQLVNLTYSGDTLVATKVTGDETVPRGEVTFTADLKLPPLNRSVARERVSGVETILEEKYGGSIYPGEGHLAKKNFRDSKYVDGLFIVYDSARFSFSWVPSKHHVFFVRPSATETLRLLRDVISKEDEIENQRSHLTRCFDMDMTTSIAREQARKLDGVESDPFRRIARQKELELLGGYVDGLDVSKTKGTLFSFWRANKWKKYIEKVLGYDDEKPSLQ